MQAARRDVQLIFQDPYSSLNPRARVSQIVREPLDLMDIGTASERDARVKELFKLVGLREDQLNLFPHQFSGGQRQRISIARALAYKSEIDCLRRTCQCVGRCDSGANSEPIGTVERRSGAELPVHQP